MVKVKKIRQIKKGIKVRDEIIKNSPVQAEVV